MNYLNLEEIKNLVSGLSRSEPAHADYEYLISYPFEEIKINNFEIVCAAGPTTYSTPKEIYPSIDDYETILVSIKEFIVKTNQYSLILPSHDDRFSYFNWTKYFKYTNPYKKIINSYMGNYVPKEDLYQIIKDTYKVSKLGLFF
jgi:hypothetical protein